MGGGKSDLCDCHSQRTEQSSQQLEAGGATRPSAFRIQKVLSVSQNSDDSNAWRSAQLPDVTVARESGRVVQRTIRFDEVSATTLVMGGNTS